MSVPIVAATLADALAPILEEIERSIGHKTSIDRTCVRDENGSRVIWVSYIHAHGQAFQGIGDTPSRALMNANTDRQRFEEASSRELAA